MDDQAESVVEVNEEDILYDEQGLPYQLVVDEDGNEQREYLDLVEEEEQPQPQPSATAPHEEQVEYEEAGEQEDPNVVEVVQETAEGNPPVIAAAAAEETAEDEKETADEEQQADEEEQPVDELVEEVVEYTEPEPEQEVAEATEVEPAESYCPSAVEETPTPTAGQEIHAEDDQEVEYLYVDENGDPIEEPLVDTPAQEEPHSEIVAPQQIQGPAGVVQHPPAQHQLTQPPIDPRAAKQQAENERRLAKEREELDRRAAKEKLEQDKAAIKQQADAKKKADAEAKRLEAEKKAANKAQYEKDMKEMAIKQKAELEIRAREAEVQAKNDCIQKMKDEATKKKDTIMKMIEEKKLKLQHQQDLNDLTEYFKGQVPCTPGVYLHTNGIKICSAAAVIIYLSLTGFFFCSIQFYDSMSGFIMNDIAPLVKFLGNINEHEIVRGSMYFMILAFIFLSLSAYCFTLRKTVSPFKCNFGVLFSLITLNFLNAYFFYLRGKRLEKEEFEKRRQDYLSGV